MNFKRTTLANGVRVITVPMQTETVTVLVLVETGSKYETEKEMGLSHFLEHMCFKGTTKRPSSLQISTELDAIGAHYNAFTGYEYTGYYAKAHARHFDTVLDVVTDIYQDQLFDQKEIDKEKGVIVEEIRMYEDMPQRNVGDVLMEALYGSQPAGRNIAGTIDSVRAFNRDDFTSYVAKHYVSDATVIVVAGNVPADAEAKIAASLDGMRKAKKHDKPAVDNAQKGPVVRIKTKQSDQTHLILASRTFPEHDPRNYPLKVLAAILGKGMSSRLFHILRDEMGVCYYVRADIDTFTDHGFLSIASGVETKRTAEVLQVLVRELRRFATEPVTEEDLTKAKEYLIGGMYLGLETSDSLADFYGFQEVLREPIETPASVEAKIRAVTAADVMRVAERLGVPDNLTLAMVSPHAESDVKIFEQILTGQA